MKKKFIIGIGSQRAGTTFFWQLLGLNPQIKMHPLKELHYFDTLFGFNAERELKASMKHMLNADIKDLCGASKFEFINPAWQWRVKTAYRLLTQHIVNINYPELFSDAENAEGVAYTGEITPEYMFLEKAQILRMKKEVGDARIVLICRNPVKRTISAFCLWLFYGGYRILPEERDRAFMSMLTEDNLWWRAQKRFNDYKTAFDNYRECFGRILLLPFDDITDDPSKVLKKLSRFLDISFDEGALPSFFKKKINTLSAEYLPGPEVMARLEELCARHLKEAEALLGGPLRH